MPLTSAHNQSPFLVSVAGSSSCTFMSSTFLQQAIAEHSSRHTELLNLLLQLESVPESLKEQTRLVDDLQAELEECEANVARLFENTRSQRRNADPGIISGGLKFSQVFRSRKEKEKDREREERNKRFVLIVFVRFEQG